MIVGGRTIGAITFVAAESGRRFDERDLELASSLAAGQRPRSRTRASTRSAVTSRRRFSAACCRPVLPDIPGVEVAARFRPAGEGYEVGGDFYDVFNTGAGWGIVIGDVCGKGPEAAALTGARPAHAARGGDAGATTPAASSDAQRGDPPRAHRLAVLHRCLRAARVERRRRRLTLASGGHPLPLLLDDDGEVDQIGVPGTLLGVFPRPRPEDQALDLEPGAALVFYTDGVIEAGNPRGAFGVEGLQALLESCVGLSANEIAERMDTAVVGLEHDPSDD